MIFFDNKGQTPQSVVMVCHKDIATVPSPEVSFMWVRKAFGVVGHGSELGDGLWPAQRMSCRNVHRFRLFKTERQAYNIDFLYPRGMTIIGRWC